jgi:replication fork protection complex subunit Tof1/Swi1
MTWPIDVIEELREAEEQDDGNLGRIDYSSLLTAQLHYKAAIIRSGSIKALFRIMYPSLEKNRRSVVRST